MEFSYFLPVNIQFGWNKVDNVAEFAAPYGKKALIVTGRTSAKKSGLYDRVVAKLDAAHIEHVLFDQVDANPLTTTALDGAVLAIFSTVKQVIMRCLLLLFQRLVVLALKATVLVFLLILKQVIRNPYAAMLLCQRFLL